MARDSPAVVPRPTYVSPGHFHRGVPVDIAEQPQTEALRVGRVGEAVHRQGRLRGVERLPHPLIQLVVGDGAPERRFAVGDRLQVWRTAQRDRLRQLMEKEGAVPL